MVAKVIREHRNDKGKLYGIVVAVENNGQFIRELWDAVSGESRFGPMTDEEAVKEWTDRVRDYRTTVIRGQGVFIRTHACTAKADTHALHAGVLRFLESRGIIEPKHKPGRLVNDEH